MKSAWGSELYDMAAWNTAQVEEITNLGFDFEEMLDDDGNSAVWEKDMEAEFEFED
jgi:hypothetical protein